MAAPLADDLIGTFPLLAAVAPERLRRLAPLLRARRLASGEMLVSRDDPGDEVFLVAKGRLRVIMYSGEGRAIPFRDLGPGQSLGELAAIDGLPRSASVEAIEAAEIFILPGPAFRDLVVEDAGAANALLRTAIGYIRDLSDRLYELRSLDGSVRIRRELLRLAREADASADHVLLTPSPRQSEIADRAGSHREAVAREFARLTRIGLIERRGRSLLVRDMTRLAAMAASDSEGV